MSTFAPAPDAPPPQTPTEEQRYEASELPELTESSEASIRAPSFSPRSDELPGSSFRLRDIPVGAWLLLLLTANLSVAWSNAKLLSQDEVFVLQTDSVGSVRQLLEVQRHTPISLDPAFYHLLGFFSLHLFRAHTPAAQAYALRLPSLLGFLLMQLCLFVFVRRTLLHAFPRSRQLQNALGARRAGLLALLLPALTATFFYSAEARPYGLLLGLCGLILVSWQSAIQEPLQYSDSLSSRHGRRGALVLLAISLALALNTHYFAVLLLLPLAAAELHRFLTHRHLDWPVLLALAAGCSSMVFVLPFQHAAAEFRAHYYNVNSVNGHAITQAYRSLLLDYTGFSLPVQQLLAGALLLAACVLIVAILRQLLIQPSLRTAPEVTFLGVLAALPLAGFAVGRFATHSFEVRYVLCALPALCALLALLMAGPLNSRFTSRIFFTAAVALLVLTGAWRIQAERGRKEAYLGSLRLSAAIESALALTPDGRIYVQDVGAFEPAQLYLPMLASGGPQNEDDSPQQSQLALLYSRDQELRWDGHDTASLTAMHLQHFTSVPTSSWQQFTATPGPHLLVLYHSGWDWTDQAITERMNTSGLQVTQVGPALGGDAVLIR